MPRWGKRALIALPWVLFLGVGYLYVTTFVSDLWDDATEDHFRARQDYVADLAYEGCVGPQAVIAQAEARGWWYLQMDEPLHWCHAPTGLTDWIHVNVSPPLPFSTEDENAAYIGFDERGCMADWHYASGPGSTCPDS